MARSKRSKGLTDKEYKRFIGGLACVVCMAIDAPQVTRTEVAHVGARGLSQKCSDRETLPICIWHHTEGPAAAHKIGKHFWTRHGLDRDKLIAELNQRYESEKAA